MKTLKERAEEKYLLYHPELYDQWLWEKLWEWLREQGFRSLYMEGEFPSFFLDTRLAMSATVTLSLPMIEVKTCVDGMTIVTTEVDAGTKSFEGVTASIAEAVSKAIGEG